MMNGMQYNPSDDPLYCRMLAELLPSDRIRLLGLDYDFQRELIIKLRAARNPDNLSPAERISILNDLCGRQQLLKGTSRTTVEDKPQRFGGRAAATGVGYEVRIAAHVAVKVLCGSHVAVWEGISGADISAITMQAPEPVDDVVVTLRGDDQAHVFISAKERSGTISLTAKSPAFADVMVAFVEQYLKLSSTACEKSRLVWAIPSSAGASATQVLPKVLNAHRVDAKDSPLSMFLGSRQAKEKKALTTLLAIVKKAWETHNGTAPNDEDLRQFLRMVYVEVYDFGVGQHSERAAESDLRAHIVKNTGEVPQVWKMLEQHFTEVNQSGLQVTQASLRRLLSGHAIQLKSSPDYSKDIERLRDLTSRNLARLKRHTELCFGAQVSDTVHISRSQELSALVNAVKAGHLLLTGEPGCGKSGLLHDLVEELQKTDVPTVLLLAEDVDEHDYNLDDVLGNWPDGNRGILVTDALDAVRDPDALRRLRNLLCNVRNGQSGWTVLASVREFDLKCGRELRKAFSGSRVPGYSLKDFSGVAHFHLGAFQESQLDSLTVQRPEIKLFVENARTSPHSSGIHRSPFYLRLAAELLCNGATLVRLADWTSPALLLRNYWNVRIAENTNHAAMEAALQAICRQMVSTRSMSISAKEMSWGVPERDAQADLRSCGILQAAELSCGCPVGEDQIRFSHHLLHDYAIAKTLIPETESRFCNFITGEPLLPVFYRQSVLFAFEELWDSDKFRKQFWATALQLQKESSLHGITRIIAPVLAARRVESFDDVQPLLAAIISDKDSTAHAPNALRHLAASLQDVDPAVIRAGATAWCTVAEQLSALISTIGFLEPPIVHIVARLKTVINFDDPVQCTALNKTACRLLSHHATKEIEKGWRYSCDVAIETICRTFAIAPVESGQALLSLLAPERLQFFPHYDLQGLAENIKHLGNQGQKVVLTLFKAAFESEPGPGQWNNFGGAIMSLRMQSRDQWNVVRHILAGYYKTLSGENASLLTEAVCIAWNALLHRRSKEHNQEPLRLATALLRGMPCHLIEDHFSIWGRDFAEDEKRILEHFEAILREWAAAGNAPQLNAVLDRCVACNQTSLVWTVLMRIGAEYPTTLGVLLGDLLDEPTMFYHPDYAPGAVALMGALHKNGDAARRRHFEDLITNLPAVVPLREGEAREPIPTWIRKAQDRLLDALEEKNIVCDAIRQLRLGRTTNAKQPSQDMLDEVPGISKILYEDTWAYRGVTALKDADKADIKRLQDALKVFLDLEGKAPDVQQMEQSYAVIRECESALAPYSGSRPSEIRELFGHLVGACASIAQRVAWPSTDPRWNTVRRILLAAANEPQRQNEDQDIDRWPISCGWPCPHLDAAIGLILLAYRLERADEEVAAALCQLCRDPSMAVRFNLAKTVALLQDTAPDLMWELIETMSANGQKFTVLVGLVNSLNSLLTKAPAKATEILGQISHRATTTAPADHQIHKTIAQTYWFHFIQSGDQACWNHIAELIRECDTERANHALVDLLQDNRSCGYMVAHSVTTNDQADEIRAKTWRFIAETVATAQERLRQHRCDYDRLHKNGQPDETRVQPVREKLDRVARLVDAVAMQLFFASGAFDSQKKDSQAISPAQLKRFWQDARFVLSMLVKEQHPHTAHNLVETLNHLLPLSPREVFLLATESIISGASAGIQYESIAMNDVVRLIQRALADYRELFKADAGKESACLLALLKVLDIFVDVGWAEARQLTYRLEEIYR